MFRKIVNKYRAWSVGRYKQRYQLKMGWNDIRIQKTGNTGSYFRLKVFQQNKWCAFEKTHFGNGT